MADYSEVDVTGKSADELVKLVNARLASSCKSIELLKRQGKLILRCWHVSFDLSNFVKAGDD